MKTRTAKKNQGGVKLLRVSMVWTVLIAALALFIVVAVAYRRFKPPLAQGYPGDSGGSGVVGGGSAAAGGYA